MTGLALKSNAETAPPRRVLVTGIGAILAGTNGVKDFWRHLRDGRSEMDFITSFDTSAITAKTAAEIDSFDHSEYLPDLPAEFAARYTRDILVAMSAVQQARDDAGLPRGSIDPERIGLVSSSARGPLGWWADRLHHTAAGRPAPGIGGATDMLRGLPGSPGSLAAIYGDIRGLVTGLSNACVGGNHALGLAANTIRAGDADAMVVCGYEFPVLREIIDIYLAMGDGVLGKECRDPRRTVRPYSRDRDGLAFGEGSVVVVLEEAGHARDRGARAYAELLGQKAINEAAHPMTMDLTGKLGAGLVRRLLAEVGRDPADVDFYCGHGTATRYNDLAESRILAELYGERNRSKWPPLGSNKPIYGHTLGVCGILNVAASALMIHERCLAPTANLAEPDPECDHDHVAEGPRPANVATVVSLAFAIGSQTTAAALGEPW
ncbi:beta-ketoacyl-[acyl-carrier-protein] synthase family protein [Amycolatopsis anabasis]|uniref:beta-ketoacyl-[acyl-carrier-protein] synthase family protein n=1 Tax=Amycolatopsis anabasis TaxID=1840409 RepID=UPI001C551053|nr:beta-ketoacyl-[acyl-carrier-protein] synthase family protein [Amycolatopsis anabasis]